MITPLLIALAIAGSPSEQDEILITNDQPSIIIPLARYDLGRPGDVRRVENKIAHATRSVCDSGRSGIANVEKAECVVGAIANANAQLGVLTAQNPGPATAAAAIAVTVPVR